VTEASLEILSRFLLSGIWIEVAMICANSGDNSTDWFAMEDEVRKSVDILPSPSRSVVEKGCWPSTPTLPHFLASNFATEPHFWFPPAALYFLASHFWLLELHFSFSPSGAVVGPCEDLRTQFLPSHGQARHILETSIIPRN